MFFAKCKSVSQKKMNTPLFLYKQNDFEKLKTSLKSCFIISLKMTSSSKQTDKKHRTQKKKFFN